MKPIWPALFTLTLLAALPVPGSGQGQAPRERGPKHVARTAPAAEDPNRARVIVKFKADGALMREAAAAAGGAALRPQHAARLAQRMGLPLVDGRVVAPRVQVLRASGIGSAELVARLARDPDVEYAEIDQRVRINAVPNDPLYSDGQPTLTPTVGQWYLRPPTATVVSAINAQAAWDITTGSASITVAVLDTGVRLDHPDLFGKLHPGYDFIADTPTAADGSARDNDPSDPGDWVAADECGSGERADPSSWHGTQVSGLIGAATDNGIGMAGVGRNVMVLPVRVLGKCGGFQSDIVAAMRWAAGLSVPGVSLNPNTARVINLSLGSPGNCSGTYQDAITELTNARVAVVVAAGNDAGQAANQPSNCNGAIGVAGVRHLGTKVGYSNVGPQLTVAAPAGNCVNLGDNDPCLYPLLTTTNTGATTPLNNTYSDSFNFSVGTSFAAPLVSGTVALMLSASPALTPAAIKQALQNSARAFPTTSTDPTIRACRAPDGIDQLECFCTTTTCGAGMLNAAGAVAAVAGPGPVSRITFAPFAPSQGGSATLDGAGSSAFGGRQITGYQWTIAAGGSLGSISAGASASNATLSTSGAGPITVNLTVTDSTGAQASSSVVVTSIAPPTVRVSVSQSQPVVGQSLTLDGSTSSADGTRTIASYRWALASGTSIASISGLSTGPIASITTTAAGSFTATLTVTDSAGQQSSSNVVVTVSVADSGGGALGAPWLLALALAVFSLARPARRR